MEHLSASAQREAQSILSDAAPERPVPPQPPAEHSDLRDPKLPVIHAAAPSNRAELRHRP